MKYDNYTIIEGEGRESDNIIRKKKKKIELIDIFILQAAICAVVSVGFVISRLI